MIDELIDQSINQLISYYIYYICWSSECCVLLICVSAVDSCLSPHCSDVGEVVEVLFSQEQEPPPIVLMGHRYIEIVCYVASCGTKRAL